MTTGLVIGKFLPPHAGHLRLLRIARAQVDLLHVVLFSKAGEPIPGELRKEWLEEMAPFATVHHVTEEHPVDYASDAAWERWIEVLLRTLPMRPDVVFSAEPYGEELARRLAARHVLVDRRRLPISGTAIRSDPFASWVYLPKPVRAYYLRTAGVKGPGAGSS